MESVSQNHELGMEETVARHCTRDLEGFQVEPAVKPFVKDAASMSKSMG